MERSEDEILATTWMMYQVQIGHLPRPPHPVPSARCPFRISVSHLASHPAALSVMPWTCSHLASTKAGLAHNRHSQAAEVQRHHSTRRHSVISGEQMYTALLYVSQCFMSLPCSVPTYYIGCSANSADAAAVVRAHVGRAALARILEVAVRLARLKTVEVGGGVNLGVALVAQADKGGLVELV